MEEGKGFLDAWSPMPGSEGILVHLQRNAWGLRPQVEEATLRPACGRVHLGRLSLAYFVRQTATKNLGPLQCHLSCAEP